MSNSSYYKEKYRQKKAEAKEYGDNYEDLNKIMDKLTGNKIYDKRFDVNKQLEQLKDDLDDAVRHNSIFDNNSYEATAFPQPEPYLDHQLGKSITSLQAEIDRIRNKKNNAEADRDYYYQKYKEAQAQELQDMWNSVF